MATAKTPKTPKATTAKRQTPKTTTDNVVPMTGEISQQLEVLREDLKALAQTVKTQALEKVESRTETAKAVASEQKEAVAARYDELSTQAETRIREKPLSSMAIAVGAGLVLGAILRN